MNGKRSPTEIEAGKLILALPLPEGCRKPEDYISNLESSVEWARREFGDDLASWSASPWPHVERFTQWARALLALVREIQGE